MIKNKKSLKGAKTPSRRKFFKAAAATGAAAATALIDKNEPEQYVVEKNGIYHLYANLRGINENTGNFLELLEIVDKKHEDVSTKQLIIEEENE